MEAALKLKEKQIINTNKDNNDNNYNNKYIYLQNIITYLHYILIVIVNIRSYVMWRTWWWVCNSYGLRSHLTSFSVTLLSFLFYLVADGIIL